MGFTDWAPGRETGPSGGGPQCVYMAWHERQREIFWKGDGDCAAPNISQTSYVWLTTCVLCQITVPEVDGDEGPPKVELKYFSYGLQQSLLFKCKLNYTTYSKLF